MKIAVFPGSFDPITKGHESVVKRALPLFDEIIVAIGVNTDKKSLFTLEDRVQWIKTVFANEPKVKVTYYKGLTVDFCKEVKATHLLRGLRTSSDFDFERNIGQINKQLYPTIETIFFLTLPEHTYISSSIVRDVYVNGGDVKMFIPDSIELKHCH